MIILFDSLHFKSNTIIVRKTTLEILNNKIPNVESKHLYRALSKIRIFLNLR